MKEVNQTPLEDVVRILGLQHLDGEGGFWATGYRSDEVVEAGKYKGRPTERPLYGSIYYLLTPGTFSRMHVLTTDEIWYYHCGPEVSILLIYPDGNCEIKRLGSDVLSGQFPQILVPRGVWQGAVITGCDGKTESSDGTYTLMSTSMAPAYCESDFGSASYDELASLANCESLNAEAAELLKILTWE